MSAAADARRKCLTTPSPRAIIGSCHGLHGREFRPSGEYEVGCKKEMVKRDNIERFLALGRWAVVGTSVWICVFLTLIICLAAYHIVSGEARLHGPWDSILFYAMVIPHIAVILCWAPFCLFLAVLLRRRLGAGSLRQILVLAGVIVPFWGVRYYDRLTKRLIETPPEENS